MDGLDTASVDEAVAGAGLDAIAHHMTALSTAHGVKPDFKHFDRFAAPPSGCGTSTNLTIEQMLKNSLLHREICNAKLSA